MGSEKEEEYNAITQERINAFFSGTLKIRPLGKPVHKPSGKEKVSQRPKEWDKAVQKRLLEETGRLRMIVGGIYSFNGGREVVETNYPNELNEIYRVIESVDSTKHKNKVSAEKTMPGKLLFRPSSLNSAFKTEFVSRGVGIQSSGFV